MSDRYRNSEREYERSRRVVPLGAQTFSKSVTQYPLGAAPLFLDRGDGARVWDVDGNEYVDFVNALAAVSLGYRDPDVDAAVTAQLAKGVSFSLSSTLEAELAERLVRLVPCAEAVRFAKNGSDATAGAIRIARAHTGRDHVAVGGYHGWQDWFIGSTTRDAGVPAATAALTHRFAYGDLGSLEALWGEVGGELAAVILEPMTFEPPPDGHLEELRAWTAERGVVLVFDEMITGFRFALGGAQEAFGVTPDLATFGKGMANGFPLACVVGRGDVMRHMEEVFFSSTFGGETLSLAAANAVLAKLEREPVLETIHATGETILAGTRERIDACGLGAVLGLAGHPSWSLLAIRDAEPYTSWELKTLFLQEALARGVLTLGTHNVSYAHGEREVAALLAAYDEVFGVLADAIERRDLHERLRCAPLEPLFRVR